MPSTKNLFMKVGFNMWELRGTVLLPPGEAEEIVVFYAKDLITWMREQNYELCNGIADWLDVCAIDLFRQYQDNCDKL